MQPCECSTSDRAKVTCRLCLQKLRRWLKTTTEDKNSPRPL
jgi:hypothetical protein